MIVYPFRALTNAPWSPQALSAGEYCSMARQYKYNYNKELRDIVTPKHLKKSPVHNWLVFPHSYSHDLVGLLKDRWSLAGNDLILDPFCGAGTTLVAAQECGIPAKGYDISPFAVFVSNVKTRKYDIKSILNCWKIINKTIQAPLKVRKKIKEYPGLVLKALPWQVISKLEFIESVIKHCSNSAQEKDFFRLGLFAVMPFFSSAQATGGWLKWILPQKSHADLASCYQKQIEMMLEHISYRQNTNLENMANEGDVRFLPDQNDSYSAIITSPPYPNRHDYTRVFGVELMYGFLNWNETRDIRYQSLHSHPESKPIRPNYSCYRQPENLTYALDELKKTASDHRIISMMDGYFIDIYCSLNEMHRVCKQNANVALVVGNAQYSGVQFLVDEIVAEIGEQVGFTCQEILTARLRGNSAQQMKIYGKKPSRESIVFLKK